MIAWVLAFVCSVATRANAATASMCASCGLEGHAAANCPLRWSRVALEPGETLADVVARARREHTRLRGLRGFSVPPLGPMNTQAELEAELKILIEAVQAEITRCEKEAADYQRRGANLDAERAALARLVDELAQEIAETRSRVRETETLTAEQIRTASAAREEILQLQESLNVIRQEIRNVRNRLFPLLQQAARAGWIHPPSTYRSMPQPLEPKRQREDNVVGAGRVDALSARHSTAAIDRIDPTLPLRNSSVAEAPVPDLQLLLERLSLLSEKAPGAAARRDEALRSLERQLSDKDEQSARLSTLQSERVAASNQLTAAQRNLTIARQARDDSTERLANSRATVVHAWIEWGLFERQEQKAGALLAATDPTSPTYLAAWVDVAETSVRLGSDSLEVIAAYPAKAAARGEDLEALRRHLAGVREKFRIRFPVTEANLPATAHPYLAKGSR